MLVVLALAYACFAGLRTVGDPDLGWQLATGRWIVQHRQVPSTDVLSYTAPGSAWIYPALSQVLLYLGHTIGGFALLSWAAAITCVVTVLLLARNNSTRAVLAILAVPIIASRTNPRAEMFTELLFAAFVALLWTFHRTGRARLWLLPVLMVLWVNLHLGFIAGLAMCAAYAMLELVDGSRSAAETTGAQRLRVALPYLVATLLATLLNPWGAAIYSAILRQARILSIHSTWIPEWRSVPLSGPRIMGEALNWRHPNSTLWWLLAIAVVAAAVAVARRRFAAAGVLAAAICVALNSGRMKGPFTTLTVIVGGSVLHEALQLERFQQARQWLAARIPRRLPALAGVLVLAGFVSVRISDLVSNRFYLQNSYQMARFGPGESAWYPEDAANFMIAEKLPGNVFNDFTVGGFLAWKASPDIYRDYIDGRSVPFSEEHFFRSFALLGQSLDAAVWNKEANERGIKTIFVSLNREFWGGLPNLAGFCHSPGWRPVYLDAYAAIFVRELPETAEWTQRLGKDCDTVPFTEAADRGGAPALRFERHLNSAAVLLALGRKEEAQRQIASAEAIFSDNAYLHYAKGLAAGFSGDVNGAEAELRRSLQIEPSTDAAYALAKLLENEQRSPEAESLLRHEVDLCDDPSALYLELGNIELATGRPEAALRSLAQAEKRTPFRDGARVLGTGFYARLNASRAEARRQSGAGTKGP